MSASILDAVHQGSFRLPVVQSIVNYWLAESDIRDTEMGIPANVCNLYVIEQDAVDITLVEIRHRSRYLLTTAA